MEEFGDDEGSGGDRSEADDGALDRRDGDASGRPAADDDSVEGSVDESDGADGPSRTRRGRNLAEFGMRRRVFGHALPAATDTPSPAGGEDDDGAGGPDPQSSGDPRRRDEWRPGPPPRGRAGTNVLSRLLSRSCLPASSRAAPDAAALALAGARWGVCDAVRLGAAAGAVDFREATCASFDRDGVLLAAGDDRGRVAIYDFDDVCALDSTGRNERSRASRRAGSSPGGSGAPDGSGTPGNSRAGGGDAANDAAAAGTFEPPPRAEPAVARPVLSFRCGARGGCVGRISGIQWSPRNQDHLAVSFA